MSNNSSSKASNGSGKSFSLFEALKDRFVFEPIRKRNSENYPVFRAIKDPKEVGNSATGNDPRKLKSASFVTQDDADGHNTGMWSEHGVVMELKPKRIVSASEQDMGTWNAETKEDKEYMMKKIQSLREVEKNTLNEYGEESAMYKKAQKELNDETLRIQQEIQQRNFLRNSKISNEKIKREYEKTCSNAKDPEFSAMYSEVVIKTEPKHWSRSQTVIPANYDDSEGGKEVYKSLDFIESIAAEKEKAREVILRSEDEDFINDLVSETSFENGGFPSFGSFSKLEERKSKIDANFHHSVVIADNRTGDGDQKNTFYEVSLKNHKEVNNFTGFIRQQLIHHNSLTQPVDESNMPEQPLLLHTQSMTERYCLN